MTTLVIHFNAFSGKLQDGYVMVSGKKVGATLTRAEVLDYLSRNADARCEALRV